MIYKDLAAVYDKLMEDTPYQAWADFFHEIIEEKLPGKKRILDLGAGTASISSLLAQKGYQLTNLDLSQEMLDQAKKVFAKKDLQGDFIQMDMREINFSSLYDTIISSFDTLNYFTDQEEIQELFKKAYFALDKKGLFIFDMNSLYKFEEFLGSEVYTYNTEELVYIWENNYNPNREIIEIDISFFIKEEEGKYRRFNEYHLQKYYSESQVEEMLKAAGFKDIQIIADSDRAELLSQGIRNFFIASKV